MPRRLLCLLAVIGCSSPSVAKKREAWVPPGDEEASVPWQQAHPPAESMPALLPPPEHSPPSPPRYKFEWDVVRKAWEKKPKELPCDICRYGRDPAGWCCLPGGKAQRAAK